LTYRNVLSTLVCKLGKSWYTFLLPSARRPIARPSDEQLLNYAREGKVKRVSEALQHHPDLVNIMDSVSSKLCTNGRLYMTAKMWSQLNVEVKHALK